jgi:2-succinyl-5-enolpyruvyl-6-hydroxy-3-cyclohexene-1-carboxylate synthase
MSNTQATMCATFVDEWARAGITDAVIAPGSRSTPLALALTGESRLRVHVFHDERAASFAALGIGLASGRPAVLLCTSGTAATHFHAAVVEAHQAGVPMLVCTADRPPELHDVGAPQTIDQQHLFGRAVRWFVDPGVAHDGSRDSWRALAARAVVEATGAWPGPVHLNLAFRDPLVGAAGDLPPGRAGGAPWVTGGAPQRTTLVIDGERILLVAGAGAEPVLAGLGLPVIADPRSGLAGPNVIRHADAVLRHSSSATALLPGVVWRVGPPPASKVVNEWLAASGAVEHVIAGGWSDPAGTAATHAPFGTVPVLPLADPAWLGRWQAADGAAARAIATLLARQTVLTEPFVARTTVEALPEGGHLVVASSMPVRDVEWFAERRDDVTIHSNRGANGIDGTIATGVGVALATGRPTTVLLGDIAFLHDSTALIGIQQRGVNLTIVVIDNDGGGIFSFLPQAAALPKERFEQVFGTPHGVRAEELAAVHGIASLTVDAPEALGPALRATSDSEGVWLVVARTDRTANVRLHDDLNAAVAVALAKLRADQG